MHGRTAFDADAGRRHLRGCFVDRETFHSRLRVLGAQLRGRAPRQVQPAGTSG